MQKSDAPIVRLIRKAQLTRADVAYHARVSIPTIDKMCRDGDEVLRMGVGTVMQVSMALGCAAAELFPILVKRPNKGLLWDRGVFVNKRIVPAHFQSRPEDAS
jgi:hypothetical protein